MKLRARQARRARQFEVRWAEFEGRRLKSEGQKTQNSKLKIQNPEQSLVPQVPLLAHVSQVSREERDTFHTSRISVASGQMNDRTFFSAGPALCSFREREAEQRDLRDRILLDPGKTTIGGPIDHAPFPRNPSGLRVGKTHSQEIGQLRTGAGAG